MGLQKVKLWSEATCSSFFEKKEENSNFKSIKILEAESILFDDFNEVASGFHFLIRQGSFSEVIILFLFFK